MAGYERTSCSAQRSRSAVQSTLARGCVSWDFAVAHSSARDEDGGVHGCCSFQHGNAYTDRDGWRNDERESKQCHKHKEEERTATNATSVNSLLSRSA